jgi:hypothetical protein
MCRTQLPVRQKEERASLSRTAPSTTWVWLLVRGLVGGKEGWKDEPRGLYMVKDLMRCYMPSVCLQPQASFEIRFRKFAHLIKYSQEKKKAKFQVFTQQTFVALGERRLQLTLLCIVLRPLISSQDSP